MMLDRLQELLDTEPPTPDPETMIGSAYNEVADEHYQWQRQVDAFRLLLGIRLVNQALDDRRSS